METNEIKEILVKRGYNDQRADLVSRNLAAIDARLQEPLYIWLMKNQETEVELEGVSIKQLMLRNKLKYPAALLSIDWIYKEPNVALAVLKKCPTNSKILF